MFRIYCDGSLLYHSNLESLQIFDPSLELELNKTGSFVFTLYPDHPRFSTVKRLKSIIEVFQDDYLLFRGRVLDEEVGWHNEKTFSCEGELAFLLDSIQRPYDFTGSIPDFLGMLLSNHNAQTDPEKQFTLGNVAVTDPNDYIVRSDIDYVNTWDVITKKLVEMLGGFLQVRHVNGVNYLDYLAESTLLAPQKITFGKNLLDLKRTRKGEDIATVIIPLGAKLEGTDQRLTIASVNGGVDYVQDSDAIAQFGKIVKTVIFDDVTEPSNLKTKGEAYLSDSVKQWESIELTAADMATVNRDITSFHLATQVQVESYPHGLNQRFRVEKLSLNLFDPAANKMTLGKSIKAFSEVIVFKKGDQGQPGQPGQPGKDGKDGVNGTNGKDGISITKVDVMYYQSTSSTALSGGSWVTTAPAWVDGRFFWEKTVVTYSDGSTDESTPVCITGQRGLTGATGATGAKGDPGSPGSPGADGKDGKDGKDAAIHSLTAPSDTSYLWLDISLDPPLLKRYDPEKAAWVIVNDTTDIVYNLETNLLATIQVTEQNIQSIVSESYYLKDEADALISSVSTEIEQTRNSVEIQFNQFSADLEAVAAGTDAEFEEIRKYIRFEDGKILLGEVGNELELQIANDRISFLQDGAEVAYFSNRKLYVTDTQILHSLQLGSFAFMPRTNGNLSFKRIT
jgi:hypothetical protein